MSALANRKELERDEAVRLINLGCYIIMNRMRIISPLSLGQKVTEARFKDGDLVVRTESGDVVITGIESIHFGLDTTLQVWIKDGNVRKCVLELLPDRSDSFTAEYNISRSRLGLEPWLSPKEVRTDALVEASKPLSTKMVGKTVADVQALSTEADGYKITFTDGTSVTIEAQIYDFDRAWFVLGDEPA